jgi:hypothetical protein
MHKALVDFMATNYPVFNPLWKLYFPWRQGRVHQQLGMTHDGGDIFEAIYKTNYWGDAESKSGSGSTMKYTAPLRAALPRLFRKYNITSVFDAPCGDFNWMKAVDLKGISYTGGDIVKDLVDDLQRDHAGPGRAFRLFDIIKDDVPNADLWICRDVLFHLTFAQALSVLRQAANSNIKYFLSTTYRYLDDNIDLDRTGGFRSINLEKAPFNLPPPLELIDDFVVPSAPRHLGLWSREQVAQAVTGHALG